MFRMYKNYLCINEYRTLIKNIKKEKIYILNLKIKIIN